MSIVASSEEKSLNSITTWCPNNPNHIPTTTTSKMKDIKLIFFSFKKKNVSGKKRIKFFLCVLLEAILYIVEDGVNDELFDISNSSS